VIQLQQVDLLRCLAKHHALKAVHVERLTAAGVPWLAGWNVASPAAGPPLRQGFCFSPS
jgi:hypothetical protein